MKESKQFFKGFRKGFGYFGESIGIIVSSISLSVVYLVGVGFTSISAKLVGKHFLDTELSKKRDTYWSDLDLGEKSIGDCYRQF